MNKNTTQVSLMSGRIIKAGSQYELAKENQSPAALTGKIKSSALGRMVVVFVLFMISSLHISAQYLENFSTPNKGYQLNFVDDFTGVNWSLSPWSTALAERDPADYFNTTVAGVLASIDLDQEVYWESPLINTTAAPTVSVHVDLSWVGFDVDPVAGNCEGDFIRVMYSVNGGAYVMVPNQVGGNACATIAYPFSQAANQPFNSNTTVIQTGIAGGSNLKIRVVVFTNANAELVTIDNVSVPEAGVTVGCAPPVVSASVMNIVCNGSNSGKINVTASAASPPYNVSWTGPSSGNPAGNEITSSGGSYSITGLAAGAYTVTVIDAASCSQTIPATVISSPINPSAVTTPSSCSNPPNGFIDLSVSGGNPGYTYSWSNGASTQDLNLVATENYTVTITDATIPGCTSVNTYTVGSVAAVDGPYLETFSTASKGYLINQVNDFSGISWTLSPWTFDEPITGIGRDNGDYFQTTGAGKLEAVDADMEICWLSPELNISASGTVQFSVDLAWLGFDNEDYITVQYSINGGAFVSIANQVGGGAGTIQYAFPSLDQNGSAAVTKTGLSGNKLQIKICILTNSQADVATIDNVSVPQNVSLCFCPAIGFTATPSNTCPGGSTGQIVVSGVSGGSGPYTYSKDNGINFQGGATFTGLAAGNYQIVVKDANGCIGASTVTVGSDIALTITCPGNQAANASANCDAVVTYSSSSTGEPAPAITYTFSGATTGSGAGNGSGSTFAKGTTTVTLTATNACGIQSCSFDVVVTDVTPPIITCPENITQNAATGQCSAVVNYAAATATDNCGSATVSQIAGLASGSVFPVGTSTITYQATDAGLIVAPTGAPGINFTHLVTDNNQTVALKACEAVYGVGNCSVGGCGLFSYYYATSHLTCNCPKPIGQYEFIYSNTGYTQVGEDYGGISADVTGNQLFSRVKAANDCSVPDTWTIADNNLRGTANTSTCSFTITVVDNQPPTLANPGNQSINVIANTCVVNYTIADPVSDNCTSSMWGYSTTGATTLSSSGNTIADGTGSGSLSFNKGVTTVTLTGTNGTNAATTVSFDVTVNDNQLPALTNPGNQSFNVIANTCAANYTIADPVFDNCTSSMWGYSTTGATTLTSSGSTIADGTGSGSLSFNKGVTTVTLTGTDGTNAATTVSFDVTVNDNQPPTLANPGNQSLNVIANTCAANYTITDPVSDNCTASMWGYSTTGATTLSSSGNTIADGTGSGSLSFNKGVTTVTLTGTDGTNAATTVSFDVTVNDNQQPILVNPGNQSMNVITNTCAANYTIADPITENCPGALWGYSTTGATALSSAGNTIVDGTGSGTLSFYKGVTTVTLTGTDGTNNAASVSFDVVVADNQPPAITCPENITVNNTPGTCGAVVNFNAPTATDNCVGISGSQTYNYTGGMQTFTVPAGITNLNCDVFGADGFGSLGYGGRVQASFPVTPGGILNIYVGGQGTENSGGFNGGGHAGTNTGYGAGGGASDIRQGGNSLSNRVIVAGGGGGSGSNCGTFTAEGGHGGGLTGGSGCDFSCSDCQYTGSGGTQSSGGIAGPTGHGSCPGNQNGFLGIGGSNTAFGYGTGGGGGYYGGGSGCFEGAGGGSSYTTPLATGVIHQQGVRLGDGQIVLSWATDVIVISQTSGLPSGSTFPVGTTTNAFLATDGSGNTATCMQTVTVTDNEPPAVVCQNITVNLNLQGEVSITPADVNDGSTDNCGTVNLVSVTPNTFDCADKGSNSVILTINDGHGNTATCNATVTVADPLNACCANPTVGGTISSSQSGCNPFDPDEITGTTPAGHTGIPEYKWQSSTDNSIFNDIAGATVINYHPVALTQTTYFKRLSKVTCETTWSAGGESNVVGITVEPTPVNGVLTKMPDVPSVCYGAILSATFTTGSGGNGTDVSRYRTKTGGIWSGWLPYDQNQSILANDISAVQIILYRTADYCENSVADTISWIVTSPSIGGTVTGGTAVCYGTNSTLLTLSGQNGDVQRWESSIDNVYWTNIDDSTGTTFTAKNLTQNTWYRALIQNGTCDDEYSAETLITMLSDLQISGYAKYYNNPQSPLDGLKITLKKDGSVVGTPVITGTTGYYNFPGLINGTYDLEVSSAHPSGQWQTWGGVNNTDYLLVSRHASGIAPLQVEPPVIRVSANVIQPLNPAILANDATAVRNAAKYGWFMPNSTTSWFETPKWVFSGTTTVTPITGMATGCINLTRNIYGLCAGDVNGSYLPPNGYKIATPNLHLVNRGTLPVTQEITFPIRSEQDMELGAITLMLDFDPSLIEITGVEMPANGGEQPWFRVTSDEGRVTKGVLHIGWMSLDPVHVMRGETVLIIHTRMTNMGMTNDELRIRFALNENPLSELADGEGNVIDGAKLAIADAGYGMQDAGSGMLSVYPNPASDILNIEYLMDRDGDFKAELMSLTGVVVAKIIKPGCMAGLNKLVMNLIELPNGAYLLRVSDGRGYQTIKVIVNR